MIFSIQTNRLIILVILFFLVFIRCDKSERDLKLSQLQESYLESIIQEYDVELGEDWIYLTSASGTKIEFWGGTFGYQNSVVNGDAVIKIIEIYDKGTMCATGKHTMSDDGLLISGGEFYFRAYKDKKPLYKSNGSLRLQIPVSLTGGMKTDMDVFNQGISLISDEWWSLSPYISETNSVLTNDSIYNMAFNGIGWFNCDKFYDDPRPKQRISIEIPRRFAQSNSKVYLSIDGEAQALGIATSGTYPLGLECHLIFVSAEEDKFLYEIQSHTLQENTKVVFDESQMSLVEPEELRDIINDLP